MEEYNNVCIDGKKLPLVAVVGPTASGKTGFAVEIAKKFNGEVISMDSMQIYKRLNIGTAKPSESEMQGIKHHLIDCVDANEPFTANDYVALAANTAENIYSQGKLPIICGGTGLYLNSLLYSYNMSEAEVDYSLREQLYKEAEEYGREHIYNRLKAVDPKSAEEIHPNNVKRVIRALEIYMLTGKPKSEQITSLEDGPFDALVFGMNWDREALYERINKRVDIMLENGLEDEVRTLLNDGILRKGSELTQAGQAIGYKEMLEYIDGEISFNDAVEKIKMNTRRYAKRQMTWFKKTKNIRWMNPHNDAEKSEAYNIIKNFTKRFGFINEF